MTRYYHSSKLPCRFDSVSHNLFSIFRLTLFALVISFVSSCEEGPTKIGSVLLPGSDFVKISGTDTLTVQSFTMYDDSVRTDNPSISYLGQIYDPYFGTTTAEFVTQIRMADPWDDLPFTVDSVKLVLHLLDVKGGSGGTHILRLSEISDQIYTGTAYYSNKNVPSNTTFTDIVLPELKPDTINDIVIKLPDNILGNYLTSDTAKLFHSNTKPDFRAFFKGLYFQLYSSSDPMLIALSLTPQSSFSSYNFIVLYMHEAVGVQKEFYFVLDAVNRNASFNKFLHDFSTATLGDKMVHRNTSYKDTLSYLQYLNGVYTRIELPGLASLKNDPLFDKITVNKARLSIPVYFDGNIYKASLAPAQLVLRYKSTDGTKYYVPDYNIDQYHSFFDGTIDTTARVYNFNIPSFVQNYLDDVTDAIKPELELFQLSGTRNVILRANKNKKPVKFQFTYTKF